MPRKVSEIGKEYEAAGALNALVNVCAFLDEHTFLTKSGDLGVVLRIEGIDYECLDFPEIDSFARRFEAALRSLTEEFRLYQYVLKRTSPVIPHKAYPDSQVVDRAIQERIGFLDAKGETLYSLELYCVILYERGHEAQSQRRSFLDLFRDPDLKVFVEPKDDSMISAMGAAPKFVAASQVDDYRQQVEIAKQETREAKRTAQITVDREVSKYRDEYPTGLKFAYHFDRDKKPFQVTSIYHDDKFTYIQASPEETPALYEVKDGKPNLINFEYRNGTYIIGKILESGYLTIGKARMNFSRQE